jgi:hypothetical protein
VDEAAEPVASSEADGVVRGRHGDLGVGWLLAEGPVRPVGVVVINVFAEGVVEVLLCVPKTSFTSCDQAVFVDQATDASLSSDTVPAEVDWLG